MAKKPTRPSRPIEPDEAAPVDDQPQKLWVRIFRISKPFLLPAACLFQVGILANVFVRWFRYVEPPPKVIVERPVIEPLVNYREFDLEEADAQIREGSYDRALKLYSQIAAGRTLRLPPKLRYRAALCNEALGNWEPAREAFQSLTAEPDPRIVLAAELGQSRVFIRSGQPHLAKKTLADIVLRSADPQIRNHPVDEDSRHLLAIALSFDAIPPTNQSLAIAAGVVARSATDWRIDRALAWVPLKEVEESAPSLPDRNETTAALQIRGSVLEASRATISVNRLSILELFEQIAEQRKWTLEIPNSLREELQQRAIDVRIQRLPLPVFMICLAESFDLTWNLESEKTLQIARQSDLDDQVAVRNERKVAHALIALDGALVEFRECPMAVDSSLEIANHALLAGRAEEAVSRYLPLIGPTSSSASVMASYNTGLAYRALGQYEEAREAFFRVVDGSPSHPLVEYAHFAVGRMYMDQGEAARAVPHFQRAHATSTDPYRRADIIVNLALSEILQGRYQRAGNLLFDQRQLLANSPSRNLAAFLVSFARYRGTSIPADARRESNYLMRAVLALGPDVRRLGRAGALIVGRAYQELELGEKMYALYNDSLMEPANGVIAAEMEFFLSDFLYDRARLTGGRSEQAVARLSKLATSSRYEVWADRARVRLAEIALIEQRPNDCLALCRDLLVSPEQSQIPTVLKLMGNAYEQSGKFKEASLCYGGQLPPQTQEEKQTQ